MAPLTEFPISPSHIEPASLRRPPSAKSASLRAIMRRSSDRKITTEQRVKHVDHHAIMASLEAYNPRTKPVTAPRAGSSTTPSGARVAVTVKSNAGIKLHTTISKATPSFWQSSVPPEQRKSASGGYCNELI